MCIFNFILLVAILKKGQNIHFDESNFFAKKTMHVELFDNFKLMHLIRKLFWIFLIFFFLIKKLLKLKKTKR